MDTDDLGDIESGAEPVDEYSDEARAFASALDQGVLSGRPDRGNFIGYYMFMGNDEEGRALFRMRDMEYHLDPVAYTARWMRPSFSPQAYVDAMYAVGKKEADSEFRERMKQMQAKFAELSAFFGERP